MARPVILFTAPWCDAPLKELVPKASEWGYQGLELACWGDHFEVQRALGEDDYCPGILELCSRHDFGNIVLSNHRVGQAVCDVIDERHQSLLPDHVWGDGMPDGVRERAVEEMTATIRAAQKLGAAVVSGFTGSPLWSRVLGYPGLSADTLAAACRRMVHQWSPILDACRDCGVRFAAEVHPGQMAFDHYSAEMVLEAFEGRAEFGFTLDPSHLHWQGVDPVEFIRTFGERIYHVHMKDVSIRLDGRSSLLNSGLPHGDRRRGWEFRAPGHGGINWEEFMRALNAAGYGGPLSVEFKDAGMQTDAGAQEACRFVRRLDFEPAQPYHRP
jgi:sugar phosphate isomerase/epimerase